MNKIEKRIMWLKESPFSSNLVTDETLKNIVQLELRRLPAFFYEFLGLFYSRIVFTNTIDCYRNRGGFMDNTPEFPDKILENGREPFIEWVMEEHGESLKRFIFTYVKNRAQTDDIFQDVLFTVYRRVHTFRQQSSFKTWLYRITANRCRDYLRSPLTRLFIWKDQVTEKVNEETPEQSLIMNERKNETIKAIMNLPVKYREVLILQYYQEFSIQEISNLLKVNLSTVKTRIMRAKERLKQELKEEFLNE